MPYDDKEVNVSTEKCLNMIINIMNSYAACQIFDEVTNTLFPLP